MARAEIIIHVRPLAVRIQLALLVPVVLLLFVFALYATIISAANWMGLPSLLIVLFWLAVFAGLVLVAGLLLDDMIVIDRSGLSIPFSLCPGPHTRQEIPWSRLRSAMIVRGNVLRLEVEAGNPLEIDLSRLSQSQSGQVAVALEVWAPQLEIQAVNECLEALAATRDESGKDGAGLLSRLWKQEMAARFSSTSFVPLTPGHILQSGRVCVIKVLAYGGFSAVYLAEDKIGTTLVVKEMVPPWKGDAARDSAEKFFKREAGILSRLSHPDLARVYDHFVEDGRIYILMEYIRGSNLRSLVHEKGIQPEERVVEWSIEMASILSYLHRQSPPIVHRDLTPDNIVLRDSGRVAVIDFGAAFEFLSTVTGTVIGKRSYMALEQLQGKAVPQSDLYALGCTMYFLLTGTEPNPLSESDLAERNPAVSPALAELIRKCTALSKEDRIESADEVIRRLGWIRAGSRTEGLAGE